MLRVGLTGGIACGKTAVVQRLAAGGVPTLDLDRLAHELMAPGQPAHREVVSAFGERILGPGRVIDRAILGATVFGDPRARERLNAIMHPKVREAEAAYAAARQATGASLLVTEAALLVESGLHLRFDRLVVVACAPEVQLARLRDRDGLDEATARSRLQAQMPVATKRRFAHYTLETGGTLQETREAADALGRRLVEVATGRPGPIALDRSRARGGLVHSEASGPRGLSLVTLAEHLALYEGLDLPLLARRLEPGTERPWYQAPDGEDGSVAEAGAAALTVPLVLLELRRHGLDEARLAASAHSLSWLLERGTSRAADTVLFALALAEVVAFGGIAPDFEQRVSDRFERSGRLFASAEPSRELRAALQCARRHPGDAEAARRAAAATGAPPGLAGALVGLAVGAEGSAEAPFHRFLDALAAPGAG